MLTPDRLWHSSQLHFLEDKNFESMEFEKVAKKDSVTHMQFQFAETLWKNKRSKIVG